MNPLLSIVIPIYNEINVLATCLMRIKSTMSELYVTYEVIFVDDGSTDGGAEFLAEKSLSISQIRVVRLSRNFGKEAALTAGIDYAKGDAVVILDADCQDPPELIPGMINEWRNGADVVLMQRISRKGESMQKRLFAYVYYRILNYLSECTIPLDTGDFRLMNRKAITAIRQLPENNRYMKGLFAWIGMNTHVMRYDREPRIQGTTKWSFRGLVGLAVNGLTSFSIIPLRYATLLGILAASVGAFYGCFIIIKTLILGEVIRGYSSLISIITFLGGMQLLCIGILGEYVGKTYVESKKRPNYLVMEEIGYNDPAIINKRHNLINATSQIQ
jgi:glycosyltransferase involved in cell wall biosynthesis